MIFISKNNNLLPVEFNSIENLIKKIANKVDPKQIEIEISLNQDKNIGLHVKKHFIKFREATVMSVTRNDGTGTYQFIGYALCEKREMELIKTN